MLALLFTGVTYVIDLRGQDRADRRQARQDLSQTISDIEALPRAYMEQINDEDPNISETAYSLFIGELVAAIAHAEDIRDAHPGIFETVDVYVIGNAQLILSNFDLAVEQLADAEDLAVRGGDTVVATAARRGLGTAYFGLERPEEARAAFQRASSMEGFHNIPETVVNGNRFTTLKYWVGAELTYGDCLAAAERFGELETTGRQVYLPGDSVDANASIEGLRAALEVCW